MRKNNVKSRDLTCPTSFSAFMIFLRESAFI
jgi:hypothetical protein